MAEDVCLDALSDDRADACARGRPPCAMSLSPSPRAWVQACAKSLSPSPPRTPKGILAKDPHRRHEQQSAPEPQSPTRLFFCISKKMSCSPFLLNAPASSFVFINLLKILLDFVAPATVQIQQDKTGSFRVLNYKHLSDPCLVLLVLQWVSVQFD